jgi:predicted secreted hydrolase
MDAASNAGELPAQGAEPKQSAHLPSQEHGTALVFPRDEGWHCLLPGGFANPSLRTMEWVYVNAHLVDAEGHHVVVFVSYFTQGLRLVTVRRFDPRWRLVGQYTGTVLGLLRASAARHDLSFRHPYGRDTWKSLDDETGKPIPHASRLEAIGPGFRLELEMRPQKPPYHAGDPGFLPFSKAGWFFYYSLTRLAVSGSVSLGDKQPQKLALSGRAWLDHQWGPFFVTPFRNPRLFEQYEWFSLQLSNGSDLILTSVWTPDGQLPSRDAYGGCGLMRADGSTSRLVGAHCLRRTHFHRDPATGAVYAAGWRLVAPEWDADLTIRPRHPDQMTPLAGRLPMSSRWAVLNRLAPLVDLWGGFWEGTCEVRGRFEGAQVEGDGFAELVKRYATPRLRIESPLIRSERNDPLVVLRWRVENWDPAVELLYRLRVLGSDGELVAAADDLEIPVFCFDHASASGGRFEVLLEAHSKDHVLRGQARRSFCVEPRGRSWWDGARS